jgi:hypothetical protein
MVDESALDETARLERETEALRADRDELAAALATVKVRRAEVDRAAAARRTDPAARQLSVRLTTARVGARVGRVPAAPATPAFRPEGRPR